MERTDSVFALLLTASCGVTMTTLSGSFYSPGYPAGYPREANCIWEIDVPDGYYITLQFMWVLATCTVPVISCSYSRSNFPKLRSVMTIHGRHSGLFANLVIWSYDFKTCDDVKWIIEWNIPLDPAASKVQVQTILWFSIDRSQCFRGHQVLKTATLMLLL